MNTNTKCNSDQREEAKDDLVSHASKPPIQSSHVL